MIVQRQFVLCRQCFDHLLLHLVLDSDVASSLIGWFSSRYVGDSYSSDVPFCDMYSTQLRVNLSAFPLLKGCILLVALLLDSFLHFLRFFLLFFLQRYPWHLDLTVVVLVPILWIEVGSLGCLLNELEALLSCACTTVVGQWLPVSIAHTSEVCHTRAPSDIVLWATHW